MIASRKLWRDSASLIVLARNVSAPKGDTNYKVLTFERTSKMSFMPNSHVFPGGVVDVADESQNWLKLYKSFGITDQKIQEVSAVAGNRPFIFHRRNPESIERDLSLRITAIREMFEELGILVCKTKEQLQRGNPFSESVTGFDIAKWQKVIQDDASKFIDLCDDLQVVPDLWSTFEWAAWLTPTTFGKRRFETAFYIVALENQPDVLPYAGEVENFMWKTPKSILNSFNRKEIWLPPPQVYELSRMINIPDLNNLVDYCEARNRKGISLFFPVPYALADGVVHVFPGDDLYPEEPDFETPKALDTFKSKSCMEMRSEAKNMNRAEVQSSLQVSLISNIQIDGHILPSSFDCFSAKL